MSEEYRMGDDALRDPLPPIPDVTLPRPSLLGPAEGSATLEGFATGSAVLTGEHHTQLTELAPRLQTLIASGRGGGVQSVGHTDRVGTDERNAALGQERADAARDALVAEGVSATDIRAYSLGEQVPVVETPRAEARNRRVEIYFSPNSGPDLSGVLTGGLTLDPNPTAPIPRIPDLTRPPRLDYCSVFPDQCDPGALSPNIFAPVPPRAERRTPSVTELVWQPIDNALERGLTGLGITGDWNQRLRDAARAGAERGATELLDRAMDAANLTGETREAVGTALRAAVQLQVPF
jgi:hypothetical protein